LPDRSRRFRDCFDPDQLVARTSWQDVLPDRIGSIVYQVAERTGEFESPMLPTICCSRDRPRLSDRESQRKQGLNPNVENSWAEVHDSQISSSHDEIP
jgi:hypothetical protein